MTHWSDRSRFESGMKCPRKRFLGYHFGGRGINPVGEAPELLFGLAIHAELEAAFSGQPVNRQYYTDLIHLVVDEETVDGLSVASETAALIRGLLHTFHTYTLPALLEEYEWVSSEQEMVLEVGDTKWQSRLDAVLRRKADGLYFVLEAKTTSWMDLLLKGLDTNFQLLMELEAMRSHYGLKEEEVGGALLLAFNKGKKQRASKVDQDRGHDGYRQLSPFTYCYHKSYANGSEGWGTEWKSGWERLPAWQVDGWLDRLDRDHNQVVRDQVQVWPSVSFSQEKLESVLRQVEAVEDRAHNIDWLIESGTFDHTHKLVDEGWPQNFSHCHNDFNRDCPFLRCCMSPQVAKDPVGSGEYEWRIPNHRPEKEAMEAKQ